MRLVMSIFLIAISGIVIATPIKSSIAVKHSFANEASGWVNPYVTDGLVAMWDGEWNASGGVHDPNATVWKDLVGGKTLQLNNGAYFSDKKLICTTGKAPAQAIEAFQNIATIEVGWNTSVDRGMMLIINDATYLYVNSSGRVWFNGVIGSLSRSIALLSDRINQDVNLTATASSAKFDSVYRNGIDITSIGPNDYWRPANLFAIGGYYNGNANSDVGLVGYWRYIRLYSRALTAEEIAHNYTIDKERFNLQ